MLLLLIACRTLSSFPTPIPREVPWETVAPDAEVQARLDAAHAYSVENAGLSMVVVEGDTLIYEEYANGHSADTPWVLWSGTKTFVCALAMEGVEQGLLDLDEAVVDTIPEIASPDITARHLLTFTSGLEDDWRALNLDGFYEEQRTEDKYALAITQPLIHEPGEVYDYGGVHHMVFGELMTRKIGGDPLEFLEENVLDLIGFRYSGWVHDPAGNPMWPYGAWTTATEWARFGVLLRDDGIWEGTQVLPAGTLEACSAGTTANPAYGLSAWLNQDIPDDLDLSHIAEMEEDGPILHAEGHTDMLVAAGARGQRVYVVPQLDWVVVLQADSKKFVDHEFLALLFGE